MPRRERNLFGWLTRKETTYTRSSGQATPATQAYNAGVRSGDTWNFDSWLQGKRLDRAPRGTIEKLRASYERGVEDSGEIDRRKLEKEEAKERKTAEAQQKREEKKAEQERRRDELAELRYQKQKL